MKYRFEYNGNPDYVTLHVTERLIESDYVSGSSYMFGKDIPARDQELYTLMHGVPGVEDGSALGDITIRPYSVGCQRGKAFDRDEVLASVLERLQMILTMRGVLRAGESLEKLPTLRTDLDNNQCHECRAENERAWKEFAREGDTREY